MSTRASDQKLAPVRRTTTGSLPGLSIRIFGGLWGGLGGGLLLAAASIGEAGASGKPFVMSECKQAPGTAASGAVAEPGNPRARESAQRGLNFLMAQTQIWQKAQNCYGCHVHAVTLEALSVGNHHQYQVPKQDLSAILDGMLTLPGGARTKAGLSYHGDSLHAPSKAFGGAAIARYDQWINKDLGNDLQRVATELLAYQQHDGSIKLDWVNLPVGVGAIQGTYQAIQTWQQAYARSADDRWLTAIQRGEAFLQTAIRGWDRQPTTSLQEVNYAILGLLAAGVGGSEGVIVGLQRRLLGAQHHDGGWGFTLAPSDQSAARANGADVTGGKIANPSASGAFPTGQVLYTLRLLGLTDRDPAIARGTQWLMTNQQKDGGWSAAGFGKAEAMWGVLGLVSLDVLSVAVSGVQDGQHVDGAQAINVEARDNQGGGVVKVELAIDDLPVYGQCGARLAYTWNTGGLATGKHIVQVTAHNRRGQVSRRQLEVYAGAVYLTQLGSNFLGGKTSISLRNIAPAQKPNSVVVRIFTPDAKDPGKPGTEIATLQQPGQQGSMVFSWDGKAADGKPAKAGKYLAQVRFQDKSGKVEQTEQLPFVHDTAEAQRAAYGEIQGQLALPNAAPAANAQVELVDERGNVVQRAWTTGAGQYRFRNVDAQKYKLRVVKKGFVAGEVPLAASKASEVKADVRLMAE